MKSIIVCIKWWNKPETNETNENQIAWCKWRKSISFTRQLFHSAVVLSIAFVSFVQWRFRRVYIPIQKYWLAFSLAPFLPHMYCCCSHENHHRFRKQFSQLMSVRSAEKLNFLKLINAFGCHLRFFKAFNRSLSYYP